MMTKKSFFKLTACLLIGCMLVSCETEKKESGANETGGNTVHSLKEQPGAQQTISSPIRPIDELNTGAGEVNSHAEETTVSRLEMNYRQYIELTSEQLGTRKATYPRLKKLADGSFILIYQDGKIGWNIYYLKSRDLVEWSKPKPLFASAKILDGADSRCYSTADAVVLQNGDILAVSSFRANKGYTATPELGGLMMRRSADGGETWSEEKVIYTGPNWEPSLLQLPSGEVQVYFTHIAPKMAMEHTMHSSGTAILRSYDNGETWTPHVTEPPYAAYRVAQQYVKTTENGVKSFTDQMPSAISLNEGKGIALAMESQLADGKYKISLAYSSDNWAQPLETDEAGPTDRQSNLYPGAAPYLAQFPSGETVLGYNEGSNYRLRIGDAAARNFGEEYIPFPGKGYWGSTEVIDSHTLVATMAKVSSDPAKRPNSIMLAKLVLNHRINAKSISSGSQDGIGRWKDHTDALFLGSGSQAQMTIRAAYDDNNLYFLMERLDRYLTKDDTASLYISSGGQKESFYKLELDSGGLQQISHFDKGNSTILSKEAIKSSVETSGSIGDNKDEDTGYRVEVAVPWSLIGGKADTLRFNAILNNRDNSGKISDTFSGASLTDQNTWLAIRMADDRIDFANGDLIIGTFFTAATKPKSAAEPKRPIDRRIGLYASNNGTDFIYLGETGLSGRDSSLMYKDGFFYMLTTATEREQFAVNIFKSKDLRNWSSTENSRYEFTEVEAKQAGKLYNWGPKWVEDGERAYVIVSFESSQDRITHGLLPFNPYPIMDTYIIPVESWGTDESKTQLEMRNIKFGTPRKVNWGEGEGLSYKLYKDKPEQISRIGSYVFINDRNKQNFGYNYILFTKVDPWGDIEIWGSDELFTEQPWNRISNSLKYSFPRSEHPNEFIDIAHKKFKRLFEGNYPVEIGDNIYLYTDNYVYKSTGLTTDGGMYYTEWTDLAKGFGNPRPIKVTNTENRPSGIESYVTRNGTVKKITDTEAKKTIAQFAESSRH